MKLLRFLALLAVAGSAYAGVTTYETVESSRTCEGQCRHMKNAGTPGTCYRSNLFRNAVIVVNDTPRFMTFFVYFADMPCSRDINSMIRSSAYIQEMIVPPHQKRYFEQRRSHYVIGTKPGRWSIDASQGRLVAN